MTTMHAPFNREVECKMTAVQADYFLRAFRSSNLTSQAYRTARPRCCLAFRAGNDCRNPRRSCMFATQPLKRKQSLLRRFCQILGSYGGNSNGFSS
jgi:hypothetical protein